MDEMLQQVSSGFTIMFGTEEDIKNKHRITLLS